jgi:hypothetical protein
MTVCVCVCVCVHTHAYTVHYENTTKYTNLRTVQTSEQIKITSYKYKPVMSKGWDLMNTTCPMVLFISDFEVKSSVLVIQTVSIIRSPQPSPVSSVLTPYSHIVLSLQNICFPHLSNKILYKFLISSLSLAKCWTYNSFLGVVFLIILDELYRSVHSASH